MITLWLWLFACAFFYGNQMTTILTSLYIIINPLFLDRVYFGLKWSISRDWDYFCFFFIGCAGVTHRKDRCDRNWKIIFFPFANDIDKSITQTQKKPETLKTRRKMTIPASESYYEQKEHISINSKLIVFLLDDSICVLSVFERASKWGREGDYER